MMILGVVFALGGIIVLFASALEEENGFILLGLLLMLLAGLILSTSAYDSGQRNSRQEAVDNGYGQWTILTGTNDVKFEWILPNEIVIDG